LFHEQIITTNYVAYGKQLRRLYLRYKESSGFRKDIKQKDTENHIQDNPMTNET